MGQKVNPTGFRIGFNKNWDSIWFADNRDDYIQNFFQDMKIKDYIFKRFFGGIISRVSIKRKTGKLKIIINTGRPGIVIGKKGSEIEKLKHELLTLTDMNAQDDYNKMVIDIREIKKPQIDAKLIGQDIARQIESRISYRRAMKRAMFKAKEAGVDGIKIKVSGRLGGTEIARSEEYHEGSTPLHTLRSNIDYALVEAKTKYGIIGIKVWVCKGELMQFQS